MSRELQNEVNVNFRSVSTLVSGVDGTGIVTHYQCQFIVGTGNDSDYQRRFIAAHSFFEYGRLRTGTNTSLVPITIQSVLMRRYF